MEVTPTRWFGVSTRPQLVFHPDAHVAEPGSYRPGTFADPANTFHEKAMPRHPHRGARPASCAEAPPMNANDFWGVIDPQTRLDLFSHEELVRYRRNGRRRGGPGNHGNLPRQRLLCACGHTAAHSTTACGSIRPGILRRRFPIPACAYRRPGLHHLDRQR